MKTVCLLLGVWFIGLQVFANHSEGNNKLDDKTKTEWLFRLNNESGWRERVAAVKDWKTVFSYNPEEIFPQLDSRLADKSQKVREAVVTAFEEVAAESDYSNLRLDIVKALAEKHSNDTDSLFLRKMELAAEIFKKTGLYTVLENGGGSHAIFEEVDVSGVDQALTALYEMAEEGLSDKKNMEMRKAALQLLDVVLDKLISVKTHRGLFATFKAEDQASDYILKGVQIAVTGLADKKPEMQLAAKELLNKTFQAKNLSGVQVSQVISSVAEGGFSHSDYKVREGTANWLLEIAELYPSLNSEIDFILEARLAKESSLHMKVVIKRARKQLAGSTVCKENWRSS